MVLFKFDSIDIVTTCTDCIYIPLWSYSNFALHIHQATLNLIYIPLWSYSNSDKSLFDHSVIQFTFHYGPIQMNIVEPDEKKFDEIYIPLWSYSNNITYKKNVQRDFIYIPLWSYSNNQGLSSLYIAFQIYIPLWSYSNA